jgi:hypothetical protein
MVPGAELRWEWAVHGACVQVRVEAVEDGRLIRFARGTYEQSTVVEMVFAAHPANATFVTVTGTGCQGSGDDAVGWVNDRRDAA